MSEKSKCTSREPALFGARALVRTPSSHTACPMYQPILSTLSAPLNPQDPATGGCSFSLTNAWDHRGPCSTPQPRPVLTPSPRINSPEAGARLWQGLKHSGLTAFPSETLPRQHPLQATPLRLRPSAEEGRGGACLPLQSRAPIGRAAGWGRDCTRARATSLLTALSKAGFGG